MTVILWNRTEQQVVMHGGTALTFKDNAAADVWLARTAQTRKQDKTPPPVFDKLAVT